MPGPLVVVAGAVANKPGNGGEAWVRMSWTRGLARLGCQVFFLEEIAPATCVDRDRMASGPESSGNRHWFDAVMREFELADASALVCGGRSVSGRRAEDVAELLREADLLVNISGNLATPELRDACRRRVFVDLDPGYTQLWADRGIDRGALAAHHVFVTVGCNIGTSHCRIPTNGKEWQHVLPPVVLDDWSMEPRTSERAGFSTIGTWRGPFGPLEWEGKTLGSMVREFRKFVSLPLRVPHAFDLALCIDPNESADLELLGSNGWTLVDPALVAGTPSAFREFVRASGAEFSVAQEMYVETSTGWFSDRSTRYLSTGRPVLVQDTGFSRAVPTGKGLVAYTNLTEALAGAETILADYDSHASAARRVAEEYFDSDRVLTRFLERSGLP